MELLPIEEFRKRIVAFRPQEETVENIDINKALSPLSVQSKDGLINIIRMLPDFSEEEKDIIVDAFEDAFKLFAEDCIQYGIKLGRRGVALKRESL